METKYNKTSKKAVLIELVKEGRKALEANSHHTNSRGTTSTSEMSSPFELQFRNIVMRGPLVIYNYEEKKEMLLYLLLIISFMLDLNITLYLASVIQSIHCLFHMVFLSEVIIIIFALTQLLMLLFSSSLIARVNIAPFLDVTTFFNIDKRSQ